MFTLNGSPPQDQYVYLPSLIKTIWDEKNYRRVVLNKSENASTPWKEYDLKANTNPVVRRVPESSSIFCLMDETPMYLRKWCHRDKIAKNKLEQFISNGWDEYKLQIQHQYQEECRKNRKRKVASCLATCAEEISHLGKEDQAEMMEFITKKFKRSGETTQT